MSSLLTGLYFRPWIYFLRAFLYVLVAYISATTARLATNTLLKFYLFSLQTLSVYIHMYVCTSAFYDFFLLLGQFHQHLITLNSPHAAPTNGISSKENPKSGPKWKWAKWNGQHLHKLDEGSYLSVCTYEHLFYCCSFRGRWPTVMWAQHNRSASSEQIRHEGWPKRQRCGVDYSLIIVHSLYWY